MKAKQHLEWVKQQVSNEEAFLKTFVTQLEALAPEEFQEEFSNGEKDKV
jgi:hypothetical protein